MKKLTFLTFLISLAFKANACVILTTGKDVTHDHPAVKHFKVGVKKPTPLIVENISKGDCSYTISRTELIQSKNGTYTYFPSKPGLNIERSLTPYMTLIDENGDQSIDIKQTLKSGAKKYYFFNFTFPVDKQNGSYQAGLQLNSNEDYSFYYTSEIYYSFEEGQAKPVIKFIKYDEEKQALRFAYSNKGNAYTFMKMDLIFIDPITGFESNAYRISETEEKPFQANIRNYVLPTKKTIISKYKLKNYLKLIKSQFAEKYPNEKLPEYLSLTIIPKYGIDFPGWSNHYYIPMKYKSLTIKTGF